MTALRTTCHTEGNLDARICIVAEAPGRWEIVKNRMLVGESGAVFEECLHAAGIVRSECVLANVLQERVSNTDEYLTGRGLTEKGRAAQTDLAHRLEGLQSNVILAMGNLAMACLTEQYGPQRGITRLRGSVYPCALLPNRKVIGTIHPASTLPGRGDFLDRYIIVFDMRKALRESASSEIKRLERTMLIRPKKEEVLSFLHMLHGVRQVAWDIEIYNHQISCIGFAPSPTLAMCIPFVLDGHYWSEGTEVEIWRAINAVLNNPKVSKLAHYGMFDESFVYGNNKILVRGRRDDTLIAHRILYPDFSSKLEFLTSIYSDIPFYKDDRKLWSKPDADPDRFFAYNCKDVLVLHDCWPTFEERLLKDEYYLQTYNDTMALADPCHYMMRRGASVDHERLEEVRKRSETEVTEKEKELNRIAEISLNANSAQQCIKYFYGIKGLKPYINRKTGNPTCDDEAMARIVRKYQMPEARLVQEIRTLRKLLSTYLEFEMDSDKRLRCFYDIRGTVSGRLSSKQTLTGTGMNMQNLHPEFRHLIIPG